MADIAELERKYFTAGTTAPTIYRDSLITPLIDTVAYNASVTDALGNVGTDIDPMKNAGHFVYLANWWLGLSGGRFVPAGKGSGATGGPKVVGPFEPYRLDGPAGSLVLREVLKDKARRGVDVRVMGWTNHAVMDSRYARENAAHLTQVPSLTMRSILDLRSEPAIGGKAILNVVGHTGGGVHAKLMVVGTSTEAIGFTGGIDFAPDRWAHKGHPGSEFWHDIAVRVEGPAVQGLLTWFVDFWQENVLENGSRRDANEYAFDGAWVPHILPTTPELAGRSMSLPKRGQHRVQSLRTTPQQSYSFFSIAPSADPLSFAPSGLQELRDAWLQAIGSAETYIYMEDQAFWSQEILRAVGQRVNSTPTLHVVLLTSGQGDPNDPALPNHQILCQSINHGLLDGLPAAARARIRMFRRWGDSERLTCTVRSLMSAGGAGAVWVETNRTTPGQTALHEFKDTWVWKAPIAYRVLGNRPAATGGAVVLLVEQPSPLPPLAVGDTVEWVHPHGVTVHSKVTLIDDHWAIIGSANCMRRSLYTDCEHSVGILDENDVLVKTFRKELWGEHFRHAAPADFDDIQASLHSWEPSWGAAGAAPPRPVRAADDPGPPYLEPVPLPLVPDVPTLPAGTRKFYDLFMDSDSRQDWGFITAT